MSTTQKRVAIYARVSTTKDQHPEVQIDDLKTYCRSRGWIIVTEIVDTGYSGRSDQRPGLKQLMTAAKTRRVDIVVVVKLDRLFRSLKHMIMTLQELTDLGVEFVSLRDQVDLTTASGRLMVQMIAAFAEFELALIRERSICGQEHARRQGKVIGRPQKHDPRTIIELRERGYSYRRIQAETGAPQGVIYEALKGALKTPKNQASEPRVATR